MSSNFFPYLLYEVFTNLSQIQLHNIDYWRYPELEPKGMSSVRSWVRERFLAMANKLILPSMAQFPAGHATSTLMGILGRLEDYERIYDSFDHEHSQI